MSSHEKHQYYYEKYLRNDMSDNEVRIFEEKMSSDESFRRSFNHYKIHRQKYLADLVTENKEEARKRWSLNSWIYLLISITGIVLASNYFLFKDNELHAGIKQPNLYQNILNRIPFLSSRNEPRKIQTRKKNTAEIDSAITEKESDSSEIRIENTITGSENSGIANDVMEHDTILTAFEKKYFEQRLITIKQETDSLINDTAVQLLTAKSVSRNTQQSKPVMVYAEFWHSPVNFRGYKFNGKKLVIYGIPAPFEIFLLRDNDEFILRNIHSEINLTRDNEFHKF